MKKIKVAALVLCLVLVAGLLVSCGGTTTKTDTEASDKTASETSDSTAKGTYSVQHLLTSELGAGDTYTLTSTFSVQKDGKAVTDTAGLEAKMTITNAKGVVVYEGAPTLSIKSGNVVCTLDYKDVKEGATCLGSVTVVFKAGSASAEGKKDLTLLPYDMSDIVLPSVPFTVNKLAGDGSVAATMKVTEITKELKYRGDTVNVRIHVKGTRTYTNGTNDYVGATVVMKVDGEVVKSASLMEKVDANGQIDKYVSFEYTPGSAPVITFEDYK